MLNFFSIALTVQLQTRVNGVTFINMYMHVW